MDRTARLLVALTLAGSAGLSTAACGQPGAAAPKAPAPAIVEPIEGSSAKKLTLTDKAVQRLAIQTTPVTTEGDRLLIPYSALLYLPDGTTFAYTNPQGHVYVRQNVEVELVRGEQAVLTAGPGAGTAVVTVGGTELWGTEFGIK